MSKNEIRVFSAKDVKKALSMRKAIEIMKEAFIQISNNQAIIPSRIHLSIPEYNGDSLIMPIYMPSSKRIGLKLITIFDDNISKNLPLIHALVLIFNSTNGQPLAIMDGSYLTALRTGAGSGLATDILARKNSKVVAIFGAGIQGRTQLEAVYSVRTIEKTIIFDTNIDKANIFAKEMSDNLATDIEIGKSANELQEADIICTATNAQTPVFSDENLKLGVHINAIGSYKPHIREIPTETMYRARIFVDHKDSCLSEAGDIIIPIKEGKINENSIIAELGELILEKKSGRKSDKEITVFKSVGNAIQDLVTANQILIEANKQNLGTKISL
ncbi:MAG: hypothetical protein FK731_09250 [Asgard group archaeon]|nr:hypothetical protein [Asgard group archaeon]